jgi:hypothetical protein
MDKSYGQVRKALLIGGGVTAASVLGAAVFIPFLIFAVAALIATAVTASTLSSRASRRWGWTWVAGIASVVWVSSAIYAIDIWGQAFNLSDASQALPQALNVTLAAAFFLSVAGFVAVILSAVVSLLRARRLDPGARVRSTVVAAGA